MIYLTHNYLLLFMFYLDACIYSERLLNSLCPSVHLPVRSPICSSVCLSVCMHVTNRERLKAFKLNLLSKCFTINCPRIYHYDRTALSAPCVRNYTFYLLAGQSAFMFYTNWFLYICCVSARIHRKHKLS